MGGMKKVARGHCSGFGPGNKQKIRIKKKKTLGLSVRRFKVCKCGCGYNYAYHILNGPIASVPLPVMNKCRCRALCARLPVKLKLRLTSKKKGGHHLRIAFGNELL